MLAAIIVVNLRGALRKFADIPNMWRVNRVDASIWLVTMATSALVNTELGLLVGVLVSAFCVLGRTQRAQVVELGRAATREHYEVLSCYRGLETLPDVAVFRYEAPIYYANQSLFKKSLYKCVGLDPGKEKAKRMKLKKKSKGQGEDQATANASLTLEEEASGSVRGIVIDCSAILFLDTAGLNALKEVRKDYGELGVRLVLAHCSTTVLDTLGRGGYCPNKEDERGASSNIFFTIGDAIRYVQSLSVPNGDAK